MSGIIDQLVTQRELELWLRELRETIIHTFEAIEESPYRFERSCWPYAKGQGGGEMAVLRGECFEKAAVNFSAVSGDQFPMQDGQGSFFATGISLITHMRNPHAPTVHMNLRYIATEQSHWLGGGYDLTPMGLIKKEDTDHFHSIAKQSLASYGEGLYEQFSQQAAHYFYLPHWQRERGVGGLFFDHWNSGDWERDLAMWRSVGRGFLKAIMPIYERRIRQPYGEAEKSLQLRERGKYVEFNLLYDRGTKFGFLSGGNPEAILCSMPPLASW